jgi:hypothetical protein
VLVIAVPVVLFFNVYTIFEGQFASDPQFADALMISSLSQFLFAAFM